MMSFIDYCNRPLSDFHFSEEIYSCAKADSIKDVLKGLAFNNIGCAVVLENKKPIGIFTERDLIKKVVMQMDDLEDRQVSEVMTPDPVCIARTAPLRQALEEMQQGRFRHLVLIDENKNACGVLSIKDALNAVTNYFNEA